MGLGLIICDDFFLMELNVIFSDFNVILGF